MTSEPLILLARQELAQNGCPCWATSLHFFDRLGHPHRFVRCGLCGAEAIVGTYVKDPQQTRAENAGVLTAIIIFVGVLLYAIWKGAH